MLFRLSGAAIILFWLASMTWLVWQDVWPGLTAGDPPSAVLDTDGAQPISCQVGLYNRHDQRIGTAWTTYSGIRDARQREDVVYLHYFATLGRCLVEIDSAFTPEGQLDEFDLSVWADGIPFPTIVDRNTGQDQGQVHLRGERFASVYGFTLFTGPVRWETFKIPASQAGLIGDVFRPFGALPDLEVGQSWRMQVVNPVAAVTGFGDRFITLLVRVTGRETITTADGRDVECLIVEAPNVKAWVDENGLVLEQRAELPVGGTITARAEAFDPQARIDARAGFARAEPSPKTE
ncbi:MAG TPA: hypothetical protein VM243_12325 [Phycisphaerae bacterium]|nr:hypothetical protein [Phycisphaerae bacterium]